MYQKIIVLVEGQTEERFAKTILQPHLLTKNVDLAVTILNTKTVKDGANFKGGVTSYAQVKNDLTRLFYDSSAKLITTMLDYYALPTDFPGFSAQTGSCYEKTAHLEQEFAQNINKANFLPYLQLHEFEALLFSSIDDIVDTMPNGDRKRVDLEAIKREFSNPEEINNRPETCPSRRLLGLFPDYNKTVYGTLISSNIGLDVMRRECPHFNEWLVKLEAVGATH